jgi:CDP-6-deoxy-D-xylo-4-hexulose-3-dehydrase
VSNGDESANLISAILGSDTDFLRSFTSKLFAYLGTGHVNVVGSNMSAYLLIMSALGDPKFGGRGIGKGDEIITTAYNANIINAAILFGVTPVVVDVDLNTMLPSPVAIEMAIAEGKTKAIILPSANGNVLFSETIRDIADEFNVMFIEDIGYGFGGTTGGNPVGQFSDIAVYTFHSNLLGDAGVIVSKSEMVYRKMLEVSNLDVQSPTTLGLSSSKLVHAYLDAQMDKRDYYTSMRRLNWKRLYNGLNKYSKLFRFQKASEHVNPSWSAFMITLKEPVDFEKSELMEFLESKKIGTRSVVGNLFQLDAYKHIPREDEELINSNYLHRNSFVVGCNPNMQEVHTDYIIKCFGEFMEKYEKT